MSFLLDQLNGDKQKVVKTKRTLETERTTKDKTKDSTTRVYSLQKHKSTKSKLKAELNILISLLGSHHSHYKRLGYKNQTVMKERIFQIIEEL